MSNWYKGKIYIDHVNYVMNIFYFGSLQAFMSQTINIWFNFPFIRNIYLFRLCIAFEEMDFSPDIGGTAHPPLDDWNHTPLEQPRLSLTSRACVPSLSIEMMSKIRPWGLRLLGVVSREKAEVNILFHRRRCRRYHSSSKDNEWISSCEDDYISSTLPRHRRR